MPSIKEIMAAKAAAAAPTAGAVIRTPDAVPLKAPGTALRATIAAQLPQLAGVLPPEPRALGETTPGPDIPFEWASEKSSEAGKLWLLARQQLNTSLGIWIEQQVSPGGEVMAEYAWIAVKTPVDPERPLLLFQLPLLNRKTDVAPF